MWHNPDPAQSFVLADALGVPLAELPPSIKFDSAIGLPDVTSPPPQGGRFAAIPAFWAADAPVTLSGALLITNDLQAAYTTAFNYMLTKRQTAWVMEWQSDSGAYTVLEEFAASQSSSAPRPKAATPIVAPDPYTWERAPFSKVWRKMGDGYPLERPKPEPPGGLAAARYQAVVAYWGDTPTSVLTTTGSLQTATMAAYDHMIQTGEDAWVLEWQGDNGYYAVLDTYQTESAAQIPTPPKPNVSKATDPAKKQIVLTGEWYYADPDDMLIHSAEIARATATATQLMLRGNAVAQFAGTPANQFSYKTADHLQQVTYTLTLFVTEYITPELLKERQIHK